MCDDTVEIYERVRRLTIEAYKGMKHMTDEGSIDYDRLHKINDLWEEIHRIEDAYPGVRAIINNATDDVVLGRV